MYLLELAKRFSILIAVLLLSASFAACSSSDDGDSSSSDDDATTTGDRGNRNTPDASDDAVTTLDTGLVDTPTNTDGGDLCSQVPTTTMAGQDCTTDEAAQTCADNDGLCAGATGAEARTCYQACVPDQCEDFCTGGDVCIPLADNPDTPENESELIGVCAEVPTGDVVAYEQCGQNFGACQAGLACLVAAAGDVDGRCFPECAGQGDTSCPGWNGQTGECVLQATDAAGNVTGTYCAVACTPPSGACPTGQSCTAPTGAPAGVGYCQ